MVIPWCLFKREKSLNSIKYQVMQLPPRCLSVILICFVRHAHKNRKINKWSSMTDKDYSRDLTITLLVFLNSVGVQKYV